ncbi:hypothetical protein AAMO2058_000839900 [Amorphochlora amoebiformis]
MSDKPKGENPFGFLYDIRRIPCMRNTLLNATGAGIALGLHSFYRHRIPMNAMLTGMKATMLVSVVTWVTCRINFHHRTKQIIEIMKSQEKLSKKQESRPPPGTAAPTSAQSEPRPP